MASRKPNANPNRARNVSIRGETYNALRDHCKARGVPIRHVVERLVADITGGPAQPDTGA